MAGKQSKYIVRNRHFLVADLAIFTVSVLASFAIRLEGLVAPLMLWGALLFLIVAVPIRVYVFLVSGIYKSYWRNAGPSELLLVGRSCVVSGGLTIVIILTLSVVWP